MHLWHWAVSGGALGCRWSPGAPRPLCVAVCGVALGDIPLHFAWQAWRLATSTFVLRGRRGTYDTVMALDACHTKHCHAPLCQHFVTHHLSRTTLSHTIFVTQNFVIHGLPHHLLHTALSHTTFVTHIIFLSHTQLCHTPSLPHSFVTPNFVTHSSFTPPFTHTHTTLSHTIFGTQLCHTQSLSHTIFVIHHLSHTTLSHTTFPHTTLHIQSFN